MSLAGKRLLGIAVILALIGAFLLATLRPDPFSESETIVAEFDKVQGLGRIDRNVRIGGANAGEIGDVTRDGDKVLVELEIEPDIVIHEDARANLRPHTLFEGSAFVDLHPGSPSAPVLGEKAIIPSEQTSTYVSLDEATRVLNEDNRELLQGLTRSTRELLEEGGIRGLRRTLRAGPDLLEDLGPTARALRGEEGDELSGVVRGFSQTTEALASREAELLPFVRNAERTAAALGVDAGEPLDRVLRELPVTLEALAGSRRPLAELLGRVNVLATELEPAAAELAPLLRDSRPLLRRTAPIVRRATPLIADLRVVMRRISGAAPALRRAVDALAPGSRVLVDSLLPAMNTPGLFGLPGYAQLAQGFAGLSQVASPFQTPQGSQNTGHVIRAGAHIDLTGSIEGGLVIPQCSVVALISQELADELEALGLCNT